MSSALNYMRPDLNKQSPVQWEAVSQHTNTIELYVSTPSCLAHTIQGIAMLLWFRFHELSNQIRLTPDGKRGMVFLHLIHPDLIIHILPGEIISGALIKESTCLSLVLNHMNKMCICI